MSDPSAAPVPQQYARATYVEWHNEAFPSDADFAEKVSALRERLKTSAKPGLDALAQVLDHIASHTLPEAKLQSGQLVVGDFRLPTTSIAGKSGAPDDSLFKPIDSIIEKVWRKNVKASDVSARVHLGNLTGHLTDLVRTSVVAPTLFHARLFAERLNDWQSIIRSRAGGSVPTELNVIETIEVDEEAKLASGYFAYHALAHCSGATVEIQIFSEITSAWRAISHRLYERSRVGDELDLRPGSRDARLVSLGHLLHLAECEHERIVNESKDALMRRKK